jgi:hypothetical protein
MQRVGLIAASILSSALGLSLCLGGCAGVSALGTPLDNAGIDAGSSSQTASNGNDSTCTPVNATPYSPPTAAQIAALPSCCTTGAAHCVPNAELPPGTSVSALATCTGGACVPDSLISSGGAAPPACKSLNGAAGVCLSLCVPQVAQYSTLLPQDICQTDERCAPCVSPLDGSDTGACEIGKSTGSSGGGGTTCAPASGDDDSTNTPSPVIDAGPPVCPHVGAPVLDPTSLPACDPNGGAHCLSTSLVPAAEAAQLATCATGLCVPDSFIESGGEFIPKTCTSLLGAEGRCLDEMIPQVAAELTEIPVDVCQSFERCVPCYDPTTGKSTGACNLSCDPGPTKPPVQVQTCCSENGTDVGECLPTTSIPTAEQSNLSQDKCTAAATLCVPKEMTSPTFKPMACTAEGLLGFLSGTSYTGVCLSKCLNFGFGSGLEIAQGNCDSVHDCAPCTNPLTNAPTGAPGCPNTPADGGN